MHEVRDTMAATGDVKSLAGPEKSVVFYTQEKNTDSDHRPAFTAYLSTSTSFRLSGFEKS